MQESNLNQILSQHPLRILKLHSVTFNIYVKQIRYLIYKVPVEKETDGKSCGCHGKHCEVCNFLEEKNTFTNKEGSDTYRITEGLHLDCNSENVIYLIPCKNVKNSM